MVNDRHCTAVELRNGCLPTAVFVFDAMCVLWSRRIFMQDQDVLVLNAGADGWQWQFPGGKADDYEVDDYVLSDLRGERQ